MAEGFVFKAVRGLWYVEAEGEILCCTARGKLRSDKLTPLVGDRVKVKPLGNGKGSLEEILPRVNSFVRPAVANLDVLVILASAVIPVTEPFLIDRMIAIAELKGCRPVVCFHKCDLGRAPELTQTYRAAGIDCVETSAVSGEGIQPLQVLLKGSFCAFTGNSGVGKSSLLNALEPSLLLPTGEVSSKLGRGRHTTRHVELFPMSNGARIADTPGFSSFDVEEMAPVPKEELPYVFPEFSDCLGSCRFDDCTHTRETGCAVRAAVEEGRISAERYHSYVRMYEQVKDLKAWQDRGYVKFSDKKKSDGESP